MHNLPIQPMSSKQLTMLFLLYTTKLQTRLLKNLDIQSKYRTEQADEDHASYASQNESESYIQLPSTWMALGRTLNFTSKTPIRK